MDAAAAAAELPEGAEAVALPSGEASSAVTLLHGRVGRAPLARLESRPLAAGPPTEEELETMHAESGLGGRFLPFLVSALFHAWHGVLGDMSKWEAIHRRDRYECTSPVCSCRDVTLHHLEYRGRDGGDEPENVASLCSSCHLDGEHGGRLRVRGQASEPTWTLGFVARPTMVVRGRQVVSRGSRQGTGLGYSPRPKTRSAFS